MMAVPCQKWGLQGQWGERPAPPPAGLAPEGGFFFWRIHIRRLRESERGDARRVEQCLAKYHTYQHFMHLKLGGGASPRARGGLGAVVFFWDPHRIRVSYLYHSFFGRDHSRP